MYYIFREQPNGDLRYVSKRKKWRKGQVTEALIRILRGWGKCSIFHVVKARSVNQAKFTVRNYKIPQLIETEISSQLYGEYIETIIINEESENDEKVIYEDEQ